MVDLKEAINTIRKLFPNNDILHVNETEELYLFGLDIDAAGCESISKNSGEYRFIWVSEIIDLLEENKIREISLDSIKE